jgi:hypothetical protein
MNLCKLEIRYCEDSPVYGNASQFFARLSFSFCLHKSFTFIRAPTTTTDSFRTIDQIISLGAPQ